MSTKSTPTRYGTVAIALHWTSAALILVALAGGLIMANAPDPAAKATILPIHASIGILALVLTLVRIGWWIWADKRPAPISDLPAAQVWASRAVHILLYVAIIAMAASGLATTIISGAMAALLAGEPLPDLAGLAPRIAHDLGSKLLLLLLVLHIGAALYHQFVRKDRLLARMGVGRI